MYLYWLAIALDGVKLWGWVLKGYWFESPLGHLSIYTAVRSRAHEISRGAGKLAQPSMVFFLKKVLINALS